jgi:hypothetical protein
MQRCKNRERVAYSVFRVACYVTAQNRVAARYWAINLKNVFVVVSGTLTCC